MFHYFIVAQLFEHNETHPMIFVGKGKTDFLQSRGNRRSDVMNDYVISRVPLQYAHIISYNEPYAIRVHQESFDDSINFVSENVEGASSQKSLPLIKAWSLIRK
jgi:hypothetical protein